MAPGAVTGQLGPRYGLIRELGRGSAGTVFLGRDARLEKELALKLLHDFPATAEELQEIQREYNLLSRIEHHGIARAHDFGYLDGRPYFTREHIDGETLAQLDRVERVEDLLSIARGIAEAGAFLHRNEILHLDIKPSNIILKRSAKELRPVLIDFGLCRSGFSPSRGAKLKGSLPYMAPEYFEATPLGPWTDVYAIGVTLYRLSTGAFPRPGAADGGRVKTGGSWDPAPRAPSRLRPELPEELDQVLFKCLTLDPAKRYRSAAPLLRALESIAATGEAGSRSPPAVAATAGRRAELAAADRFLEARYSGSPSSPALLVTGPPGMGQSHFLKEVKMRAETRGFTTYLETGYAGRPGPLGSLFRWVEAHLPGESRPGWKTFLAGLSAPRPGGGSDALESERRLRRASRLALAAGAITKPILLIVDGLQFCDEVSQGLVIDFLRYLRASSDRAPVGAVIGYREEGPAAPLLAELSLETLDGGGGEAIALGPLGVKETQELYRRALLAQGRESSGQGVSPLGLFQKTGGSPRRIVLQAAGAEPEPARQAAGDELRAPADELPRRPQRPIERTALTVLRLLDRPAEIGELCRICGLSAAAAKAALAELRGERLAEEIETPAGRRGWVATALGAHRAEHDAQAVERRRLHLRIARHLVGSATGDAGIVEALKHFRLAGSSRGVATYGLRAGRYLKSTFQNRAALDLLGALLESLPVERQSRRLEIAIELAELHARVGGLDRGILVLRQLLSSKGGLTAGGRLRCRLRLAVLYSRRGDFRRADAQFREALGGADRAIKRLPRGELLYFVNEHAAVKAFKGEYADALRLCSEGLSLAGGDPSNREVALNLHATRANVALRTFDFEAAIADFEKARDLAEAAGSLTNQAVVLNNLGIVYNQCDRYAEALASFREAEAICLRLDEGPSLAPIYGNVAIIHAKTGDFAAMDKAQADAERLGRLAISRRQEFFLRHARGLSLVCQGRYGEAAAQLREAIALSEAMGDRHLASFDGVYLAEALLFLGQYGAAQGELERYSESRFPGRVRKLALARLALLGALTCQTDVRRAARAEYNALSGERAIPYLDAWDDLYLGWSLSLANEGDRGAAHLDRAEVFFRPQGLKPGAALAAWVKAERCLIDGDLGGAERELAAGGGPASDLTRVLWPLLSARLLLASGAQSERRQAADLLAEAGAALIGNDLPEWYLRVAALQAHLQGEAKSRARIEERRRETARQLPRPARLSYLRSWHWKTWTLRFGGKAGKISRPARTVSPGKGSAASAAAGPTLSADTGTVRLDGAARASRVETGGLQREQLVARSQRMQEVCALLDRLRGTDLPVLIRGETGAGKELIARIIHEESRWSSGPFCVVDMAAIPSGLVGVELFGARAGAFTDSKKDRPGIVFQARGGTVFIDEVGGADLESQAMLSRMISQSAARPLGSEKEEKIEARFLFSTARDLEREVADGRFREDLLHRIRVLTLEVPPLRERIEDLPQLVECFFREGGGTAPSVAPAVRQRLSGQAWPGNVRELKNLLARLRLESPERIEEADLERLLGAADTGFFPTHLLLKDGLPELQERLERDYIIQHFRRLQGDTKSLCRFLKLGRRQLFRRCERLKISLREERRRLRG